MRRLYLILSILSLVSVSVQAQDLLSSRQSSYYTFIYKLSNAKARALYADMGLVDTTYLHNLFDFYPTDSTYKRQLALGHYLFVETTAGVVNYTLRSVNNLNMTSLSNHHDLMLVFNDSLGRKVPNADVRLRGQHIPFDGQVKAYRLRYHNKIGVVSASYQGHVSYFAIGRLRSNALPARVMRKISNFISGGVYNRGLFHRMTRIFNPRLKPYKGYLVFNKPMYRPGDTLRFKAMVTTGRGRPLSTPLVVRLERYDYEDMFNKKLGTITPFRKGAYQFEFVLTDSLNLKLDYEHTIDLYTRRGHNVLSEGFKYEDYVLKNNTYSVRSERPARAKPPVLYLKGSDTNGMPVFDTRVDVLLLQEKITYYGAPQVFVPDTLWFYRTRLDPVGETRICIPDSVMPKASLHYKAE